jgi:hypothetical protein
MPKFLVLASVLLLMPNSSFAQNFPDHPSASQCQMIRQAVAQYGYAAAKQHALATYGPEAVSFGEQCFATRTRWSRRHEAVDER